MKITLLSYHDFYSKNRAGFHFIADELAKLGHSILFVTAGLSVLTLIKYPRRFGGIIFKRIVVEKSVGDDQKIRALAPFSVLHPVSIKYSAINNCFTKTFERYSPSRNVAKKILDSDLVIVESCSALVWLRNLQKECKQIPPIIYRVSDDLDTIPTATAIKIAELGLVASGGVNLVSCPSQPIAEKFNSKHSNVLVQPHGIACEVFDKCNTNPYSQKFNKNKNVVFVGLSLVDQRPIEYLAKNFPTTNFHLIGKINRIKFSNCYNYGVLPFKETVPYIKYADVGLQAVITGGSSSLRYSLKIQQYTYCCLPIVGPAHIDTGWGNYYGYTENAFELDICNALSLALKNPRKLSVKGNSKDWGQVTREILAALKC
jgi:2-beta-glucuronyltransferase